MGVAGHSDQGGSSESWKKCYFSGTKSFGCDVNMKLLVDAHVLLRLAYLYGPTDGEVLFLLFLNH